MTTQTWEWDESLYAGSARHYSIGRMPYPARIGDAIRDALALDGTERLLDVGCGPGSLTLLLAPYFRAVVGVDADAGMLAEAERRAGDTTTNVEWRRLRAEELSTDLGRFQVVTFAQSFHWMDQRLVAERMRGLLDPTGAWVHVFASTHWGVPGDDPLPLPRPPWDEVQTLIEGYLGKTRRAGQGTLPTGTRPGEEDVMRAAGYHGPHRVDIARGEIVERGTDELVSSVFSLSGSAPHLFGERLGAFEADLRRLLLATAPDGRFAERTHDIQLVIWRP